MIKTAFSLSTSAQQAAAEIKQALQPANPALVVYFSSVSIDPESLSKAMAEAFPESAVTGCTTAGELISGQALRNSVVAMALGKDEISDLSIQVIDLGKPGSVTGAVSALESHFNESLLDLDPSRHVGLILFDGLSGKEERVMDQLANLSNVIFVGGSAGDDLKFQKTFVFANGKAYSNAVVLALLKPNVPFSVVKTQSFKCLPKVLVATSVDEANRLVKEFNSKPAAEAYAEAVGVPPEQAAECFMINPLGLMVGEEPYVRSPQRVAGSGIHFYCAIKEGMELNLLASDNLMRDTQKALDAESATGGIAGVINFNCILRTLELQKDGKLDDYAKLFAEPMIGFSTYGEAYLGHINQTATMLVFKKA